MTKQVPVVLTRQYERFTAFVDAWVQVWSAYLTPDQQVLLKLERDHVVAALNPKYSLFHPEIWQRAIDTRGASLRRGAGQMWLDLLLNGGKPSVSDNSSFAVGVNIGTTPREVFYETPLAEVVRYTPVTETVYDVPMVIVPPLINGPDILDLQPGQSLVEYLRDQGHVVYMLRWKPVSEETVNASYEDYIDEVIAAFDAIDVPKVNTLGLCMGGDLLAKVNAYLAETGRGDVVNSQSTIVTMIGYPDGGTGAAGAMIDQNMIDFLRWKTSGTGVMKGSDIAAGFSNLLPDALLYGAMYRYWFLGEPLPVLALMAWNAITEADIPARAFIEYLVQDFVKNEFANGTLKVHGVSVTPRSSLAPRLVVSGKSDHIVPSDTALASCSDTTGPVYLVEVVGGHVGAIAVKQGGRRAKYLTYTGHFPGREAFERNAQVNEGRYYDAVAEFLTTCTFDRVPQNQVRS
ncbi:MAG: hypothetical protein WBP12_01745 [Candidatus Saccharimonas sp.]